MPYSPGKSAVLEVIYSHEINFHVINSRDQCNSYKKNFMKSTVRGSTYIKSTLKINLQNY